MGNLRTQYLMDKRGKKKGVILPLARYRRLLEDLHDLAVVAERRREQAIPLDEMKRRLKSHGAL
ncbi:MAG: hypothetical protein ACE145_12925 [Terriglobia bacterium]